ncbi:hypothetical protein G6F50_018420 [Rhizopus delemar]|uniref:Uncharacterized protein n=1 Tax=Rhizopus delemar TaxID=936053 RepID=A0A9P6XMH7_9FUNG|nr:hypothetical protein G6F50_018420 [Rhizopus delemar]
MVHSRLRGPVPSVSAPSTVRTGKDLNSGQVGGPLVRRCQEIFRLRQLGSSGLALRTRQGAYPQRCIEADTPTRSRFGAWQG